MHVVPVEEAQHVLCGSTRAGGARKAGWGHARQGAGLAAVPWKRAQQASRSWLPLVWGGQSRGAAQAAGNRGSCMTRHRPRGIQALTAAQHSTAPRSSSRSHNVACCQGVPGWMHSGLGARAQQASGQAGRRAAHLRCRTKPGWTPTRSAPGSTWPAGCRCPWRTRGAWPRASAAAACPAHTSRIGGQRRCRRAPPVRRGQATHVETRRETASQRGVRGERPCRVQAPAPALPGSG